LAKGLYQRFGGAIAIPLELARGPIVSVLQKHAFFTLFPINPAMLAKYREAFKPSRAKGDPADAELALDLWLRHAERFSPLRPQSTGMLSLPSLIEQRRELVGDKTRLTNSLKQYYLQALEWFDDIDTVLFCDFLTHWPTLPAVRRANRKTLAQLNLVTAATIGRQPVPFPVSDVSFYHSFGPMCPDTIASDSAALFR
jgi:hypothetical protein